MNSWDIKEVLLASLPSAGLSMNDACRTHTTKVTFTAIAQDKWDDLPITTKDQGKKGLGYVVTALCPAH